MSRAVSVSWKLLAGTILVSIACPADSLAQPELVFLKPVVSNQPALATGKSMSKVRLTPVLWQATESNEPADGEDTPVALDNESEDSTEVVDSSEDAEEPAEDAPRSLLDSGDAVALDGSDVESKTAVQIFRFNESAFEWTLRGADLDGVGIFTFRGGGPSWQLEFDEPATADIDFHTGINFVSGPSRPGSDLPERLFDFGWHFHTWAPEFLEIEAIDLKLGLDVSFDFGIHADFEDSARDGWRFPGRVLLVSGTDTEGVWLAGGFELLDLEHIQMLPAGGIVMRDDDANLELFFPRPRLSVRVDSDDDTEEWLYIVGEYRGAGWAIERSATGLADVATLSEYRLAVGIEIEPLVGNDDDDETRSQFWEVSWLFNRDLEYRSGLGNTNLHDTVMFRVGSRF